MPLPDISYCAVQHGLNGAFEAVKLGEFYQMIKSISDSDIQYGIARRWRNIEKMTSRP